MRIANWCSSYFLYIAANNTITMLVKQFFLLTAAIYKKEQNQDEINSWLQTEDPNVQFVSQSESSVYVEGVLKWNCTISIFYLPKVEKRKAFGISTQ